MPCFVGDEENIRLAQYGSSNIGRMKTLYRQGLKNRYGSLMQVIAGVHFNFSMPDSFWCEWQELVGEGCCSQRFISDKYMGLIRNVYRFGWLVPYLFGASRPSATPSSRGARAACRSRRPARAPFTCPMPRLCAVRSRLHQQRPGGAQDQSRQPARLCEQPAPAINTHDPDFAKIGVKVNGEYRQLNDNVLQLENELYAPIRPKRTPQRREAVGCAGAARHRIHRAAHGGRQSLHPVRYRGGSDPLLRSFLVWCLRPSPVLSDDEVARNRRNQNKVVLEGVVPA
jgi:glutamate--cysteine ligase